jgi:hypothetical protein
VRGDAVHKGQERATAITVTRQRHHGGQAHLLCHVISRKTGPIDRADSRAAVSDHDRADRLQHSSKRVPITCYGLSYNSVETFLLGCHRRQHLQRYEPGMAQRSGTQ